MFTLASKFVNCPVYLSIIICLLSMLEGNVLHNCFLILKYQSFHAGRHELCTCLHSQVNLLIVQYISIFINYHLSSFCIEDILGSFLDPVFQKSSFCIITLQDLEGECCLSLLGLLRSNLNLISFPLVSLKLSTECFNNL
jgi:hypothetical protein